MTTNDKPRTAASTGKPEPTPKPGETLKAYKRRLLAARREGAGK